MSVSNREFFHEIGEGTFIPQEIRNYEHRVYLNEDAFDMRKAKLSQRVAGFSLEAPRFLLEHLFYWPYCREEGLMVERVVRETTIGKLSIDVPSVSLKEVDLVELEKNTKWQSFMDRYQLPREALVRNVREVLRMIPRENTGNLGVWNITLFDQDMEIGAYKVALTLIPDLTDDEAKILFNNLTTAGSIKEKLGAIDNPPSPFRSKN